MQYAMAIDLTRCIGCWGCVTACKHANNLPVDVWWNKACSEGENEVAVGTYPNVKRSLYPLGCQHCTNPSCVDVCPTGASIKNPETGVVEIDQDTCIGCKSCIEACPYDARTYIEDEPKYYIDHAVGDFDAHIHKVGIVEKCTFCTNRISRDEPPACMVLCSMKARVWGDIDDPTSEISTFMEGRDYEVLLEEEGTGPNVFYLK